jgi:hypothetical protein
MMGMNDYIEREAAVLSLLDKGQHSHRYKLGEIWELNFEEIREAINSIPAADVRPVVLCRDCKHRFITPNGWHCPYAEWGIEDDDFCSCGKKREES